RAYTGGMAYYAKSVAHDDIFASDLWSGTQSEARGVIKHDAQHTAEGATLYTSSHESAAYLISATGEELHRWQRHFSEVWDETAAVKHPQPDDFVYMRRAKLDGNGDLLALFEGAGDTPYGYGLVKLDKDSNVIWRYLEHTHHDFDIAPDGNIYVLTHEIIDEPEPRLDHLATPRIEDFLAILSPDGKELHKIPLLSAVDYSDYRRLFYTVSSWSLGDPLHTNSVHVITEQEAAHFPHGEAGQVLISFRELNAVGVLDADKERLVWATKGPWLGQHDPHILDNGNLLLFDNNGDFTPEQGDSRVLEFDPDTLELQWQYTGSADEPLHSVIRSEVQRLPNGNTLITESSQGRILEVAPDHSIVWEFVNPVRGGPDGRLIPIVCNAQRVDPYTVSLLTGTPTPS
ncbi:MAG TPA: arylsulfotransferase family protein, partial [Hyphomicrobiales bacterium]|nr:arylsulfotransferase family protein [Hyphomicrobiales bacterium]